jgi:hypothetical protein
VATLQSLLNWSNRRDGLLAVVYGIDEKGRIVGVRGINDWPRLPDGVAMVATYIAVVPYDQPHSTAGREHDRTIAIVLRPFTVVLDCAFFASLVPFVAVEIPLTILMGGHL